MRVFHDEHTVNATAVNPTTFDYFLVACVILVSGSLWYSTYFQNIWLIPILVITVFGLLAKGSKSSIGFDKAALLFTVACGLGVSINQEYAISSYSVFVFRLLTAFLIVSLIPFRVFATAFIRVMLVLAILSLFYIPFIYFGIASPLPQLVTLEGDRLNIFVFSNFIGFGIREIEYLYPSYRNCGLFWEPGAFQLFLNLALFFSVVLKLAGWRTIAALLLVLATTQSTTGFVVVALIFLFPLLMKEIEPWKKAILGVGLLTMSISIAVLLPTVAVSKFTTDSANFVSYLARYYDHYIDFQILLENPLLGTGYGNLGPREAMIKQVLGAEYFNFLPTGADSLLLFLSFVGIFGCVYLFPLLFPRYLSSTGNVGRIIGFFVFVILFSTENLMLYLLFNVLVLYGLEKPNRLLQPEILRTDDRVVPAA